MMRINLLRPFLVWSRPAMSDNRYWERGRKSLSCSESGTSSQSSADISAPLRESRDFTSLEARALIVELLELMRAGPSLSQRICDYLAKAEDKERDVWLRDDIRLAFLTVLYAGRGYDIPDVWAYYYYLGAHPKKIIPILVERAEKHAAMEAPPKKPAQPAGKQECAAGISAQKEAAGASHATGAPLPSRKRAA